MQLFTVGVTVIVADIGVFPVFVAVNDEMFPEPLPPKPIAVLEFVHVNVPPAGVLIKFVDETVPLLQTVIFAGIATIGVGFTVMV
jgi:hypothetical protein